MATPGLDSHSFMGFLVAHWIDYNPTQQKNDEIHFVESIFDAIYVKISFIGLTPGVNSTTLFWHKIQYNSW